MREHLKDYFIPHAGNAYKPHSLQKAAVVGMGALILLTFALANVQSLIWMSSEWMVSTILPSVIVDLTNDERDALALVDLRRNTVLDRAAQMKAQHMAANQYFSHHSPDGISPWYWFGVADYNFVHAGENLAIHFTDSDEVVRAWMNSPSHRANIVNSDYTEIGVGAAEGTYEGYKTVYVVQLFGTPAVAAAPTPAPVVAVAPEPEPVVLAETETTIEPEPTPAPEPVEVAEAEPVETNPVIAGSEEIVTEGDDGEVTLSSERDPVVVESEEPVQVATATEVADIEVTDDAIVLYSDFVSTTTGGVPATIDPTVSEQPQSTAPVFSIATKPQMVLQVIYVLIGLFVLGALILSVFIEIRRQHPVQIAYSAGLMAAMVALFYIHVAVTAGATVV